MPSGTESDFPLFPLGLVALPHELVPLHIFEARYRVMLEECLEEERPFGIVWAGPDGLHKIGCAVEIADVLDRLDDGRTNIRCRGTAPFLLLDHHDELGYPSGTVDWISDTDEEPDAGARAEAHEAYRQLVREAAGRELDDDELSAMSAYAMAATVEFGLDAKQSLLDLRSENARLRLSTRLFRSATKRLDFVERAQVRARSNGTVRFG